MENVENAKELLKETLSVLKERKIASKALADVDKRVVGATGADKSLWKKLCKIYANKGLGWSADNPLELDSEAKHKDIISPIFIKLLDLITVTETFEISSEILGDYLEALEDFGIKITIDSSKFDSVDTGVLDVPLEEELKDAKAYLRTMTEFSDEIKEEHSKKSEDLNFTPASSYSQVVGLYRKGVNGKEIDDDVQNILSRNEMIDTAVNLVAEYVRDIEE